VRTQVAIIGAGPAGLFLGHLLRQAGIDAFVIERSSRTHAEKRVRAGVLEKITVDTMASFGLDARLRREGLVHTGANLARDGHMFRIDFHALADGASTLIYGQQEIVRDLFDAAEERQLPIIFSAESVCLHRIDEDHPFVTWRLDGVEHRLDCDFIAGCDGQHGVCRGSIPDGVIQLFERATPYAWLGVLADVPPADPELIYSSHEHGFALASMRSESRSRYYVQCNSNDSLDAWPDERFWDELCVRLGPGVAARVTRGPSSEKSMAPLRSCVAEPMQFGRLFLCGDAAHIVPPAGAKGLNLAVSDVVMLSQALVDFCHSGSTTRLDGYSARVLARVWKAERFSWWFTELMHNFPERGSFGRRMQIAEFDYLRGSKAAQTALAENYVGLPLE
jgi:p-hydroxybenzoate 3-monooxygenase